MATDRLFVLCRYSRQQSALARTDLYHNSNLFRSVSVGSYVQPASGAFLSYVIYTYTFTCCPYVSYASRNLYCPCRWSRTNSLSAVAILDSSLRSTKPRYITTAACPVGFSSVASASDCPYVHSRRRGNTTYHRAPSLVCIFASSHACSSRYIAYPGS